MKRRILSVIMASIMLFSLTGCENKAVAVETGSSEVTEETEAPEQKTEPEEAETSEPDTVDGLKRSVNEFNKKLYEEYPGTDNLFYSPYSIVSALALADLAAKGETRESIEKTLSIEDFDRLKKEVKAFNTKEQSESAYFTFANGLFIDKSLKLSPDYEKSFKEPAVKYFDGEFRQTDFGDTDAARREITDWVKAATKDMIPDYSAGADKDTVADILNAIYFYGEWEKKFMHDDSYEETFHGTKGDKTTDMMHMEDVLFRYLADEQGITAAALPYAGGKYEMDILMYADNSKKDLSGIFSESNADEVLTALDNAEMTELGMLAVPKFKMDFSLEGLKEKLIDMGMGTAFSDSADFSLLADNIKISDVCHRAVIEVDEEGSRAAAVTEVMMALTSVMEEEEKPEFRADRPFIYLIRERESGIILFTGRYSDPM